MNVMGPRRFLRSPIKGHDKYRGEIIARVDGPKTLKEIDGKKMAYVDPISSSGHLLPEHLLKNEGVKPEGDRLCRPP